MTTGPLDSLRIVVMGGLGRGPFCGMLLGADDAESPASTRGRPTAGRFTRCLGGVRRGVDAASMADVVRQRGLGPTP